MLSSWHYVTLLLRAWGQQSPGIRVSTAHLFRIRSVRYQSNLNEETNTFMSSKRYATCQHHSKSADIWALRSNQPLRIMQAANNGPWYIKLINKVRKINWGGEPAASTKNGYDKLSVSWRDCMCQTKIEMITLEFTVLTDSPAMHLLVLDTLTEHTLS